MGSGWPHAFTVFTATYQRAHTLPRVYESLRVQTFRDFEWLVVDDGSTDATGELVARWVAEADFPIRFIRQEHRGKHFAFNRGVREARGALFLSLDSDDTCVPDALARFKGHWDAIPEAERSRFSAVTALCMDQHGRLVGTRFPRDVVDSDSTEIRYRYGVRGEKWGFHRTEVLRRYPFPEDMVETYVPEGVVWSQIARGYRTRFVNEVLRVYWREGPSMVRGQDPAKHAAGGRLQHQASLNTELAWFAYAPAEFLRSAVHYARFSFHTGAGIGQQLQGLTHPGARMLWAVMVPIGFLVYARDRLARAPRAWSAAARSRWRI